MHRILEQVCAIAERERAEWLPEVTPQQLEQDLRDCMADMRQNQLLFDMETEPELIDQRIYEYQAIQSRYRYLQRQARAAGLRAIL